MSTGSEPPAGRSTELARSFVARDRDGIRTQNLSRRTCQSRSRVQEAFKARRPSLELSGWAPVRSPGQQSGSRRGGALRGTRVAGPLSPAEGQRRDRRSLASGNNDSSSASARARPAPRAWAAGGALPAARAEGRPRPLLAPPPAQPRRALPGPGPPSAASLTGSELEAAVAAAAPQRALALLQDVVVLGLEELHAGPGCRGRRRRRPGAPVSPRTPAPAAAARGGRAGRPSRLGPPEPAPRGTATEGAPQPPGPPEENAHRRRWRQRRRPWRPLPPAPPLARLRPWHRSRPHPLPWPRPWLLPGSAPSLSPPRASFFFQLPFLPFPAALSSSFSRVSPPGSSPQALSPSLTPPSTLLPLFPGPAPGGSAFPPEATAGRTQAWLSQGPAALLPCNLWSRSSLVGSSLPCRRVIRFLLQP